jgi:hypothetical protein
MFPFPTPQTRDILEYLTQQFLSVWTAESTAKSDTNKARAVGGDMHAAGEGESKS